jgi:hypothetical protein
MPKKKEISQTESKIELKQRKPGKANQNFFAEFKQRALKEVHPIDEMFPEKSDSQPDEISGRPQIKNVPSTDKKVDVLPSTEGYKKIDVDVLPSTSKKVDVHIKNKAPSTNTDRHNKNLARYDNRIDVKIKQKIDMFCAEFNFTQREIAEQSAVHFIDMWTARFLKLVDGKPAHDDRLKMIMWKTEVPVINLYRAYNFENKWKFKDDEVGLNYNDTDLRLLELGIIETQFNSNFKKINSFGYYKNQIDNFIEQNLGEEMLQFLIAHYRQKWQKSTGKEIDLSFLDKE